MHTHCTKTYMLMLGQVVSRYICIVVVTNVILLKKDFAVTVAVEVDLTAMKVLATYQMCRTIHNVLMVTK